MFPFKRASKLRFSKGRWGRCLPFINSQGKVRVVGEDFEYSLALGPLISNYSENVLLTRPIFIEIRPILTQMVSQNRFFDSQKRGQN